MKTSKYKTAKPDIFRTDDAGICAQSAQNETLPLVGGALSHSLRRERVMSRSSARTGCFKPAKSQIAFFASSSGTACGNPFSSAHACGSVPCRGGRGGTPDKRNTPQIGQNKTPPRLRRVLPYDGARGCVLNAVCGDALRRGTYIRPCGCLCGLYRLRSRTSGPAGSSPFPRWRALSRWWRCCRRPRARRS